MSEPSALVATTGDFVTVASDFFSVGKNRMGLFVHSLQPRNDKFDQPKLMFGHHDQSIINEYRKARQFFGETEQGQPNKLTA